MKEYRFFLPPDLVTLTIASSRSSLGENNSFCILCRIAAIILKQLHSTVYSFRLIRTKSLNDPRVGNYGAVSVKREGLVRPAEIRESRSKLPEGISGASCWTACGSECLIEPMVNFAVTVCLHRAGPSTSKAMHSIRK